MTGQPAKAEVGVKEICEEADKYFTTGKADHYYYHNGVYDARCPLFVVFFAMCSHVNANSMGFKILMPAYVVIRMGSKWYP